LGDSLTHAAHSRPTGDPDNGPGRGAARAASTGATHPPQIGLRGVTKTFLTAAGEYTALRNIDLEIDAGEFVAVVGSSGSGKSTLLNMLSGIDRPTSGEVRVGRMAVHGLSESDLSLWRGRNVGVVFQFFQLLPTLTAIENVMLPMDFCGTGPARERKPRAAALLERMGVADQADKLPETLSGGQRQRVAIARALANDPPVLLADEPTGNLDSRTSGSMMQLFSDLTAEGKTVIMVTHEREAARFASRSVSLEDGRVVAGARLHA
jgi:putative ABC transport system ATP-binding protein